jgi:hypothetical protein
MIDHELELELLDETLTGLETRVAAMAGRAIAIGARELSADMSLSKAWIKSLKLDMVQLRRAPSGGIAVTASRSHGIQQLKRSIQETEPRLCALESLLNEYVRRCGR